MPARDGRHIPAASTIKTTSTVFGWGFFLPDRGDEQKAPIDAAGQLQGEQ
jgi:hypothetical protein